MVTCYIFVFYEAKLYSDMGLQVIFIFLQLYGWWAWLYAGPEKTELPVSRLSFLGHVFWLVVIGAGTTILGYVMATNTDAALPYPDAFITAASLVAQWLLGRKILESWVVWIVVDLVSIGVFFVKELYPTTGLYIIFLSLACCGLWAWRRQYSGTVVD